eukprot:sb/3473862/
MCEQDYFLFYHLNFSIPGGWVAFTARMYHSAVSWICYQSAMVTISIDYRRPPEHPFPTALEDTYYVVKWAQHNAKRLGNCFTSLSHPTLFHAIVYSPLLGLPNVNYLSPSTTYSRIDAVLREQALMPLYTAFLSPSLIPLNLQCV